MLDLDELAVDGFGYWLAGFIDGEAYFHIAKKNVAGRRRYSVKLEISLRDDDAPILREIVARTGLGKVFYHRTRQEGCGDVARWSVIRRADIFALCGILDRFPLRAKKQADYEIWRAAAVCWQHVQSGGGNGAMRASREAANELIWIRMEELREDIMETRAYTSASAA